MYSIYPQVSVREHCGAILIHFPFSHIYFCSTIELKLEIIKSTRAILRQSDILFLIGRLVLRPSFVLICLTIDVFINICENFRLSIIIILIKIYNLFIHSPSG